MLLSASLPTTKKSTSLLPPNPLFLLFLLFLLPSITTSLPQFLDQIPNGHAFSFPDSGITCEYLGHQSCVEGAPLNPFGADFASVGFTWTKSLCNKDSDGDGLTNGQELGDPCCVWKASSNVPVELRLDQLSHPGDADEVNDASAACGESESEPKTPTLTPAPSNSLPPSAIPVSATPSISNTSMAKPTPISLPTSSPSFSISPARTLTPVPVVSEVPEVFEVSEQPNLSEQLGQPDASGQPEQPDASGQPEQPDAFGQPEQPDASGQPEQPGASEQPEQPGILEVPEVSMNVPVSPGLESTQPIPLFNASKTKDPSPSSMMIATADAGISEIEQDQGVTEEEATVAAIAIDKPSEPSTSPEEVEESVCFPGQARVTLQDGTYKRMRDIEIGDSVLIKAPSTYSEIFMLTHYDTDTTIAHNFITIQFSKNSSQLSLTPGHYIYVNDRLLRADAVRVGDLLDHVIEGKTVVTNIVHEKLNDGLYNPQTIHGDIVVENIKASTYTAAVNRFVAHGLLTPLRGAFKAFGWSTNVLESGFRGLLSFVPKGQ